MQPAVMSVNRFRFLWLLLAGVLALSSCFKEDTMAPPVPPSPGLKTGIIEMGPSYGEQFYYSLNTNSVLSQNSRFAYDLLFECGHDSFRIWLNTAKFMSALKTNKKTTGSVTFQDTIGRQWRFETGQFSDTSSALGVWWSDYNDGMPVSDSSVYLISLGRDGVGEPLGYVRLQIGNYSAAGYSIRWQMMNSSVVNQLTIPKDITRNYRYVSLTGGGTIVNDIEPHKDEWDFCLTRYTYIFYEPYYLPYEVVGVLHNPSRITAYLDSTIAKPFDSVALTDINFNRFYSYRDAIGYEWKTYSGIGTGGGTYSVRDNFYYFIRQDGGKIYKLRFRAYDRDGVNGYPVFEYGEL
ncbi:MAG: hypothetical protein NZM35_05940 [Chitinophagales bacterium]|nr:hypothetical protein [Chitinophagales bacterium]MDW8419791.1 hypothetical protein [Chitinophagales bacterium]